MILIRVKCDVCLAKKDKVVDYSDLPTIRGVIDSHFTRIKNKSLCSTCVTTYKTDKEEMELRHKEERAALIDNLINP